MPHSSFPPGIRVGFPSCTFATLRYDTASSILKSVFVLSQTKHDCLAIPKSRIRGSYPLQDLLHHNADSSELNQASSIFPVENMFAVCADCACFAKTFRQFLIFFTWEHRFPQSLDLRYNFRDSHGTILIPTKSGRRRGARRKPSCPVPQIFISLMNTRLLLPVNISEQNCVTVPVSLFCHWHQIKEELIDCVSLLLQFGCQFREKYKGFSSPNSHRTPDFLDLFRQTNT